MTQNTQTTAGIIEKLLNDTYDTYPGSVYDCFRVISTEIAAKIDALTEQLAEARAEVEHLRLPAEAWETLEAAREAGRTGTEEDEDAARSIHKSARDRARAAKEAKP